MNHEKINRKEKMLSDADVREKYHAWKQRYEKSLKNFISQNEATYEDLVNLVWERGILDHIAPVDLLERKAREQKQADLFDRNSNDSELYWRIMYAAGNTKETIQKNMTMVGGYTTLPIVQALYVLAPHSELQKKLFPEEGKFGKEAYIKLADSIIQKAQEEIKKKGGKPHDRLLPIGSQGIIDDIAVTIDMYGSDGLIVLKVSTIEDHMKLGEKIKELSGNYSSSISPQYLDPEAFHVEK